MNEEIVAEVKRFVEEECRKPTAKYDFEVIKLHFLPVVNYSVILADKLNANREIVEISAWFHDIGSIIYGRENHHVTSCEIAEKKLIELNYPEEKRKQVLHCIYAHRGSQSIKRETREAEILAEADSMSHFDDISRLFKAAFLSEKKSAEESRNSVRIHLINSYNKLSEDGKEIVKSKFEAAMLLLE